MEGNLIENEENRENKCPKYTTYRRNIVHAICEKVTRREKLYGMDITASVIRYSRS